jgi:hypothetical protein
MDKPLIEWSEYITVVLVYLVVPVTGFLLLFIGEIRLLRKKKWVDEKQTVKYPLITFLINIPVVIISMFDVLDIRDLLKDTAADRFLDSSLSAPASMIAYSCLVGLVLFFLLLVIFFLIRLATTPFMSESGKLTWTYIIAQAALLAAVLSIVHPLGQIIFALFMSDFKLY